MKGSPTRLFAATLAILAVHLLPGQNPKGTPGSCALVHATIVTVTSDTIDNGTVVLQGGKITAVGTQVTVPGDVRVIDCTGLWIFPGLIDAGTLIGLIEIGSDQRTQDFDEIGDIIPQLHALTAVNPNSVLIPVARVNGVTTALARPRGSLFPGTAALINLFGYTPDQMFAGFEGVVLEYPAPERRRRSDNRSDAEIENARKKVLDKLDDVWDKAEQYARLDSATRSADMKYYPEMEALLPVIRGEKALMIEVKEAKYIHEALAWVKTRHVPKVIFTGVDEGWRVAGELASDSIPVIAGPVLSLPERSYDRYDKAYANPGLMRQAGVKVALQTMEAENVRNLPYNAGFAANYGMGTAEALRAVTIVPAEVFGVSDKLGSVTVGKDATLFVTDGDPFETKTQVKHVFIKGWEVPLVSRQTELYDEFLHRTPGLDVNPPSR